MKQDKTLGLKMGTIVLYKPAKNDNTVSGNTENPTPAIVTEVLDEYTANLTVFRDGPPVNKYGVKRIGTKSKTDNSSDPGGWTERES